MRISALLDAEARGLVTENENIVSEVTLDSSLAFVIFGGIFGGLVAGAVWVIVRDWLPRSLWQRIPLAGVVASAGGSFAVVSVENQDFKFLDPASVSRDVERMLRVHAGFGWTPAEIERQLIEEFGERVPELRTIQRHVKKLKGDPWNLASASEGEAELVLSILGHIVASTNGRQRMVTKEEAHWIARIRSARPDIYADKDVDQALAIFLLAQEYVQRERTSQPTEDLDLYLALAPWEGEEEESAYKKLAVSGWLPPGNFVSSLRVLAQTLDENGEVS